MGKEDVLMIIQGIFNMLGVVALIYFKVPVEQIVTILGALNGLSVAKHAIDMKNGHRDDGLEKVVDEQGRRIETLEKAVAVLLDKVE